MPKNRVIYQNEVLYVGPSPATGIQTFSGSTSAGFLFTYKPLTKQLHRIQSINYGYSLNRRDVNQFGELAAIDRILLESPVVNLDFSYLNANFYNELMLGFYVASGHGQNQSCISNILNKTQDDKNYFIKTVPEGVDAVNHGENHSNVLFTCVGNGFISNFSTEASVGNFPSTNVSVEGLNLMIQKHETSNQAFGYDQGEGYTGVYVIANPAVNPLNGVAVYDANSSLIQKKVLMPIATSSPWSGFFVSDLVAGVESQNFPSTFQDPYNISALRPGDIRVNILEAGLNTSLQELGVLVSDAKIQSYNLSFSLSRDPLEKLGSKYAFGREIRFPVQVSLSIDANVGDLYSGNLVDAISQDKNYDVEITINHPQTGSFALMKYILKNAKLDSQSYTSSIGPNKAVSLGFSSQVGGPLQTTKGLFFSGYFSQIPTGQYA